MSDVSSLKPGSLAISNSMTTTLAQRAVALEAVCNEIDQNDGVITDEMIARFDDAKLAVAEKVDSWIWYLDTLKTMAINAKVQKKRAEKAQKSLKGIQDGLNAYLKSLIQTTPDVPFRGKTGALYIHKSPPGVAYSFVFDKKTLYNAIDPALLDMEPTLAPYVKAVTGWVLDGSRVMADLP